MSNPPLGNSNPHNSGGATNLGMPIIGLPFVNPDTGLVNRPWWLFLQNLYTRVGGNNALSITDLTYIATQPPAVMDLFASEDRNDFIIPGPAGPIGPAGPAGAFIYAEAPEAEMAMLIPGAPGATGPAGASGIPYANDYQEMPDAQSEALSLSPVIDGSNRWFNVITANKCTVPSATGGIGYSTGAGGAVTQLTSRVTAVTINKPAGAITLFTASGSATASTFQVNNSLVAATDTICIHQSSGTNLYQVFVTAVSAGNFKVTFFTTGGTASDAPVINFALIKSVTS